MAHNLCMSVKRLDLDIKGTNVVLLRHPTLQTDRCPPTSCVRKILVLFPEADIYPGWVTLGVHDVPTRAMYNVGRINRGYEKAFSLRRFRVHI